MGDTHDTRYKKLFSHPELVREVLESFVHEDFVRQLDYDKMVRVDKSFVGRRYRRVEADLIWQIPLAGEPVYLYLLVEFQSTVDHFLALRMLRYLCEFYEFLRSATKPRLKSLPPVFPLLLYNGDRNWTAPLEVRDLIKPPLVSRYLPAFRYYPLIEKDIPDTELLHIRNAVAAVFYLEKSHPGEMELRLRELGRLLGGVSHPLRTVLQEWFLDYLRYLPGREKNCSILEENMAQEADENMFETALKDYVEMQRQKAIAEGHEKGHAEGRQEGLAAGEAAGVLETCQATLIRLFARRFGIDDVQRGQIADCGDPVKLAAALDVLLDADTPESVLERLR